MNIRPFSEYSPTLGERVYIDPSACVIGRVWLADDVSIWPGTVLRGDVHEIHVGARTNIQDLSIGHVTHDHTRHPGGFPLVVGEDVTVGHRATLHGCEIHDRVLVGMNALIMDGVVVESDVLIAAGTLVPPGKRLKSGYLYMGQGAKTSRPLTDEEREYFLYSANHYVKLKNRYLEKRP